MGSATISDSLFGRRARLVGYLVVVVATSIALILVLGRPGPPARLVAQTDDPYGVIVNGIRPVQIRVRVLDADDRLLPSTGLRYQWLGGTTLAVSAEGVVTCTPSGDATVRASLGSIATDFVVHCRPVSEVHGLRMMNLVVGDSAQPISVEAVDADGEVVTLLAAAATVGDSAIATLEGKRIRGRAPGETWVTTRVGDQQAHASVHVYERGSSPEGIRPGQHIGVPVGVAGGDMRTWRLSAARELYFVTILPDGHGQPAPAVAVVGANCSTFSTGYFCLAQRDASVVVYHPGPPAPDRVLRGTLAVWRHERP